MWTKGIPQEPGYYWMRYVRPYYYEYPGPRCEPVLIKPPEYKKKGNRLFMIEWDVSCDVPEDAEFCPAVPPE